MNKKQIEFNAIMTLLEDARNEGISGYYAMLDFIRDRAEEINNEIT